MPKFTNKVMCDSGGCIFHHKRYQACRLRGIELGSDGRCECRKLCGVTTARVSGDVLVLGEEGK